MFRNPPVRFPLGAGQASKGFPYSMTGGPGDKQQLGRIALKQKLVAPTAVEEILANPSAARGSTATVDRIKALSDQLGVPAGGTRLIVLESVCAAAARIVSMRER